jgi:calcium-dependent protein kinase
MPFYGSDRMMMHNIEMGRYRINSKKWTTISAPAIDFVQSLLEVDPEKRLTAHAALEHRWIVERIQKPSIEIDNCVVDALRHFSHASKFQRCCFEMMAWLLTAEDRAKVRDYFLSMDETNEGTISFANLAKVLQDKFNVPPPETTQILKTLAANHGEKDIRYSDFLAAMVSTRIDLYDDLLEAAFKRFEREGSGYITEDSMRQVTGERFEGTRVKTVLRQASKLRENRVSFEEFASHLREDSPQDQLDNTWPFQKYSTSCRVKRSWETLKFPYPRLNCFFGCIPTFG